MIHQVQERERERGGKERKGEEIEEGVLDDGSFYVKVFFVCLSLSVLPELSSRYVELNPDLQGISNRPEWFYVFYSPDYHPMKAYTLEFQWMAATISILHKLVSFDTIVDTLGLFASFHIIMN